MKRDFPLSSTNFFQKMMQQSMNLLKDNLHSMHSKKDGEFKLLRVQSPSKKEKRTLEDANMS